MNAIISEFTVLRSKYCGKAHCINIGFGKWSIYIVFFLPHKGKWTITLLQVQINIY